MIEGIWKIRYNIKVEKFILFTFFGTLFWNSVLGFHAGDNWHDIINFIDMYTSIVIGILILGFIILKLYRKKKTK